MLTERLRSLDVFPFRLRLLTQRDFSVPVYKGSIFRGGFGQLFRGLTCTTGAPSCEGCARAVGCGYSEVFESPVLPQRVTGILTKYPNAPHPFVLCPPLDSRTWVPRGSELDLDVTLIGPATKWFAHFLFIFSELGRQGTYGGPYRIDRATSRVDGSLLFDGSAGQITAEPARVSWDSSTEAASEAEIETLTPLRMRTDGYYNTAPDFVAFIHALLGRLHLLTSIYGGQSPDRAWMRDLLALADEAKTDERDFEIFRWNRTSGRQHKKVPMDGVLGRLRFTGQLGPFLPALRAGELLHVGSGTSMGLGRYRARWR